MSMSYIHFFTACRMEGTGGHRKEIASCARFVLYDIRLWQLAINWKILTKSWPQQFIEIHADKGHVNWGWDCSISGASPLRHCSGYTSVKNVYVWGIHKVLLLLEKSATRVSKLLSGHCNFFSRPVCDLRGQSCNFQIIVCHILPANEQCWRVETACYSGLPPSEGPTPVINTGSNVGDWTVS